MYLASVCASTHGDQWHRGNATVLWSLLLSLSQSRLFSVHLNFLRCSHSLLIKMKNRKSSLSYKQKCLFNFLFWQSQVVSQIETNRESPPRRKLGLGRKESITNKHQQRPFLFVKKQKLFFFFGFNFPSLLLFYWSFHVSVFLSLSMSLSLTL